MRGPDRSRRSWGRAPLAALLLLLAACQTPGAGQDAVVLAFMEATFDAQPGGDIAAAGELKSTQMWRWDRPVVTEILGSRSAPQEAFVRAALAEFSQLTGVAVTDASVGAAPNFRVAFTERAALLLPNGQISTCVATFRGQRDGEATMLVTLSNAKSETVERCVRHEMMHAFGFLGHSHRIRSVLSYLHSETALTRWDKVLLGSLYDQRLRAGMGRAEVAPLLPAIVAAQMARFPD